MANRSRDNTYMEAINVSRRDFLRGSASALILVTLPNLVAHSKTYAAKKDARIAESNKKTRKRIKERTFSKDGKTYLRISDLVNLEIVHPNDTGAKEEYIDPLDTGVPLIRMEKSDLDKKVTESFRLKEYARIPNPQYNEGVALPVHIQNGRTYHKYIRLDPQLVGLMQKLRTKYQEKLGNDNDAQIVINSAYRNSTYNKKVGGEAESRHRTGQAVDIKGTNLAALRNIADSLFSEGGLGKYNTFVHVDTRGFRARW